VNNYDYIVDHNWDSCGDSIFLVVVVVDGDDDDKDNSTAAVVEAADYFHGKMVADIGCVEEYDDD